MENTLNAAPQAGEVVVRKSDGSPFASITAAKSCASRHNFNSDNFRIVEVNNGYAIIVKEKELKPTIESVIKQQDEISSPWIQPGILDFIEPFKDNNFDYRWVNRKEETAMKRYTQEWRPDNLVAERMREAGIDMAFGNPLGGKAAGVESQDNTVKVRDLVLFRRPKSVSEKYYRRRDALNKLNDPSRAKEKLQESMGHEMVIGDIRVKKFQQ